MAKTVNITNGTGTANLINDTYNITADVTGYDNSTINPNSITVVQGTNEYAFTIAATGTLTLHVTEDGTESGTPIIGATFIRTDSAGVEYGDPITTNAEGNAIFNNVPFAETDAPLIYYKQTASDGDHEFVDTVQNISLTTNELTIQIPNSLGEVRTISLTDANYANLPIENGNITFNN